MLFGTMANACLLYVNRVSYLVAERASVCMTPYKTIKEQKQKQKKMARTFDRQTHTG